MADLSNRLEQIGVKTEMIGKGPFKTGCRLQLQGRARYELHSDGSGRMTLGVVEENGRLRMLAQTGTTAQGWSKIFAEVSNAEQRKAATL
jgi:hypothetical protein